MYQSLHHKLLHPLLQLIAPSPTLVSIFANLINQEIEGCQCYSSVSVISIQSLHRSTINSVNTSSSMFQFILANLLDPQRLTSDGSGAPITQRLQFSHTVERTIMCLQSVQIFELKTTALCDRPL